MTTLPVTTPSDLRGRRPGHRVVVLGAGWAGLAAALGAREAHAEVIVVDGGLGASGLGPGTIDDVPWDERERSARTLGAQLLGRRDPPSGGVATDLAWIVEALGADRFVAAEPDLALPRVATTAGRLRTASAIDASLLDLARLPDGARVIVPRVDRATWDADSLVRILAEDPHARARGLSFLARDADVLRYDDERRIPDADLAARHDDPARLEWLAVQLRDAVARAGEGVSAILLGPWLGLAAPRAAASSQAVGVAVGEAAAATSATAGLRFEAAFQRVARQHGIRVVRDRAVRIDATGDRSVVHLERGEALEADGVVLATGGLAGGGVVFDPPEHGAGAEGADSVRAPFRLSVDCGVRVEARGDVGIGSSAFGPAFDEAAWPAAGAPGSLELVGLRASDLPAGVLYAAGDVVAGRPRTAGEAVSSGRRAGMAAATV